MEGLNQVLYQVLSRVGAVSVSQTHLSFIQIHFLLHKFGSVEVAIKLSVWLTKTVVCMDEKVLLVSKLRILHSLRA
jgi:hypothetical protein